MNDVVRLVAALGDWDARPGPRYRRLADGIAAGVERGVLDGMRLPAERRLAERLGASRSTVARAYAELRERGLVDSRQRSGTVVRSTGVRVPGRHPLGPAITRLLDGDPDAIDLCVGAQRLDSAADEVFLTGTAAEITPVREIDGRRIGDGSPGPVTRRLQELYADAAHGRIAAYRHWLDVVAAAVAA